MTYSSDVEYKSNFV